MYLTHSRSVRLATLTALYFGQGIPLGLFAIALPAWMAQGDYSAAQIATFVSVMALPWAFKLFSGPFMDRFSFPAMGQRRPWVLAAQLGLLITYTSALLLLDDQPALWALTTFALTANSFAAMQDVAVDGMAIAVLPEDERGRANSFMVFGQVLGGASSAAVSGWLLTHHGVASAVAASALAIGLIWCVALGSRERPGERLLPWTQGHAGSVEQTPEQMREIFGDLFRALTIPTSLGFVLASWLGWMGYGVVVVLSPLLAVAHFAVASEVYTQFAALANAGAALLVVLLSPWVDRFGPHRTCVLALTALTILTALTAASAAYWSIALLMFASALGLLLIQLFFVGYIANQMNLTWIKVAATQFAVYMALSNLAQSAGSAVYGLFADLHPSELLYGVAACYAAGAIGYAKLNPEQQKRAIAKLAANDPEPL